MVSLDVDEEAVQAEQKRLSADPTSEQVSINKLNVRGPYAPQIIIFLFGKSYMCLGFCVYLDPKISIYD